MDSRLCVAFIVGLLWLAYPAGSAWGQGGFSEADANGDGKVVQDELESYVAGKLDGFSKFKELMAVLDSDKDGSLSEEEFGKRMEAVQSVMESGDDNRDAPNNREGRRRRARRDTNALKVGDLAPTFKLKSLDGESETDLADFKGDKPVVLIFGSYT